MSDERELSEKEKIEATNEQQAMLDGALSGALPTRMTHAEIVARNRALWQQGDADAER